MAKTIHLQITDETEKLFRELANLGMTERQVFAKAIGLLRVAYQTGRVGVLKPGSENISGAENIVEYVFDLQSSERHPKEEPIVNSRDQERPLSGPHGWRIVPRDEALETWQRGEASAAKARARTDEYWADLQKLSENASEEIRRRNIYLEEARRRIPEQTNRELQDATRQAELAARRAEEAAEVLRRALGREE